MSNIDKKTVKIPQNKEVVKKFQKRGGQDGDRGTRLEPYSRGKLDLRDILNRPNEEDGDELDEE